MRISPPLDEAVDESDEWMLEFTPVDVMGETWWFSWESFAGTAAIGSHPPMLPLIQTGLLINGNHSDSLLRFAIDNDNMVWISEQTDPRIIMDTPCLRLCLMMLGSYSERTATEVLNYITEKSKLGIEPGDKSWAQHFPED